MTRNHFICNIVEVLSMQNPSKTKAKSYCKKHSGKKLKLYCETCEELICTYCVVFEHVRPDHICLPLEEIAERKREELKKKWKGLQETIFDTQKQTRSLKEHIECLSSNFNETERLIREKRQQLLKNLQDKVDKKTNSMIEHAR